LYQNNAYGLLIVKMVAAKVWALNRDIRSLWNTVNPLLL